MIDAAILRRIVKIAGMLGSDQLGERAAAAERLSALLAKEKLTWEQIVMPTAVLPSNLEQAVQAAYSAGFADGVQEMLEQEEEQPAPPPPPPPQRRTFRVVAGEILDHYEERLMGDREANFVHQMCLQNRALSTKQAKWLRDICDRIGVKPWEGA